MSILINAMKVKQYAIWILKLISEVYSEVCKLLITFDSLFNFLISSLISSSSTAYLSMRSPPASHKMALLIFVFFTPVCSLISDFMELTNTLDDRETFHIPFHQFDL